ncbi:YraN family protein [Flexilinea flocculi]|jgi:putative endonuclease|uniref:UPF0102 protein ATC1_1218 n=1 Tax=Flexilinea flocculi TaxID=1678840 RepID=A0A0K8PAE2_9CHLR|nr:YraN family protein [Flexilinea flocculi]GAP39489.1 predicted endonuclease [Flexilinea flocculi]
MTKHNVTIGHLGENIALQSASQKGMRQIGRNIRTPFGEIDLILVQQDTIVFTEVKTRTSDKFGYPEEAVTKTKLEHMMLSAQYYMEENDLTSAWRIDIVAVSYDPRQKIAVDLKWMENVTADL